MKMNETFVAAHSCKLCRAFIPESLSECIDCEDTFGHAYGGSIFRFSPVGSPSVSENANRTSILCPQRLKSCHKNLGRATCALQLPSKFLRTWGTLRVHKLEEARTKYRIVQMQSDANSNSTNCLDPDTRDETFCISCVFQHVSTRLFHVAVDLAEWTSKIRLHGQSS